MSKLYVVMYHYTRDLANSRYPGIKGLDYSLFKEQVDFFAENFNVITMEEVIDAWNSPNAALPEKAMLLTFDDGYIDNYLAAFPVLKAHHMQGSFFIPGKTFTENVLLDVNKIHFILASTGNVEALMSDVINELNYYRAEGYDIPDNEALIEEYAKADRFDNKETVFVKRILQTAIPENLRNMIAGKLFEKYVGVPEDKFSRELYMNRDQIKCMKDEGMFIGLHGYDHYWLGNLSKEKMCEDVDKSLEVMEEFIDCNRWVLNYPYGSYNDDVINYVELRGGQIGMTTEVEIADTERDHRFLLPRLDCNDFPPKSENYRTKEEHKG